MAEMLLMFVLALMPIIWLVSALCGLKMEAYKASFGAFVVAAVLSMLVWHMAVVNTATAALEGVAMAIWPIVIVIIAAVFTYNLTVHTGAMEKIKGMLTSVSSDKRVLALLIGWCFGGFLEGMAGFGTAVAIPASMLMALGFNPMLAILSCLLANGVPTMFGSIGIPTTTLAGITGLDPVRLAVMQALQVAPFVIVTPILMVVMVGGGFKALKGVLPITLASGISVVVAEVASAQFIGADLPMVVAAVVSLLVTFAMALGMRGEVPAEYALEVKSDEKDDEPLGAAEALNAWCPFILIFVVLVLTSKLVPFIHEPLSAIKSTVNIYSGDPNATLTFSWINTPGVLILICGMAGGLVQGCSFPEMLKVLGATVKQMSKTILTMLSILACAKIMGYSGMIASVAAFFVGTLGAFYPLISPILGGLGTFVTGSGTSSEVLFGAVQQQAAGSINADSYWLCAANSLGVSAGKMISPQNIAIGTAACGLVGKDGEIMGKISKYAFGFAAAMAVMVYVGVLLGL
ncbi:L-lactate permease [Parafannyhessea umbonata]|uniref:L-lactate permease n=1 Tax=Parafannyhessea umbonata TaxID=604330 RepID=A0A1H9P0S5_9ACTN|nr:lactate permease LctP family transporter [Parafannyhessea umbonata]SER41721.1 lactate permease [Parafannyhessea umbonata]